MKSNCQANVGLVALLLFDCFLSAPWSLPKVFLKSYEVKRLILCALDKFSSNRRTDEHLHLLSSCRSQKVYKFDAWLSGLEYVIEVQQTDRNKAAFYTCRLCGSFFDGPENLENIKRHMQMLSHKIRYLVSQLPMLKDCLMI